jgi:hypothetical protein
MNQTLQIVLAVIAWVASGFTAFTFYKAGKFKLTASIETLVGAGMSWTKQIPAALVRIIAALELLGAIGIILAPAAVELFGFAWAKPWAVAAAGGLALTMLVAGIMHIVRGEFKYTYKANISIFAIATVATVLWAIAL